MMVYAAVQHATMRPCRFMTSEQRIQAGSVELTWLPRGSGADGESPASRAAAATVLPWAQAAAMDVPLQVTDSKSSPPRSLSMTIRCS